MKYSNTLFTGILKYTAIKQIHIIDIIDDIELSQLDTFALHQGAIHKEWNKFYAAFEKSGLKPTKGQVEAMVKKIDDIFGHLFNPPK